MKLPTIKLPTFVKNPILKKNSPTKVSNMDVKENSTTDNTSNNNNTKETIPLTKNSGLIKKSLIRLKTSSRASHKPINKSKMFNEKNKMSKEEMISKRTSSKINIEVKKVESKNYKKQSYNKSVPNSKSDKIVEKNKLSGVEIVKEGKSGKQSGITHINVSSKGNKLKSSLGFIKPQSSTFNKKKESCYSENEKEESLLNEKQITFSKNVTNSSNISKTPLIVNRNRRNLTTNNINEAADPVSVIKQKKQELAQRSKYIKQKQKKDLEELLKKNDNVIRRTNTKEILKYESTFNTDAPPLFCENAYKISKLSPIENCIDAISSILEKQKNEAIPLLEICAKNGKITSNMINLILESLIEGDECVLNKLNKNKLLQEEILADLENVLKDVLNLQSQNNYVQNNCA